MKNMNTKDSLSQLGSLLGGFMIIWTILQQFFPFQIRPHIEKYFLKFTSYIYPFIQVKFNEYTGERMKRGEAYPAIESYLASNASQNAKRLKADLSPAAKKSSASASSQTVVVSMDDHEEVVDEFEGVRVWWSSCKKTQKTQSLFGSAGGFQAASAADERRYYKLSFHRRHRALVLGAYLAHVIREGKAIKARNRQRRLYTNGGGGAYWSHVAFEHPASFETLAMDPETKREIVEDLQEFGRAEEFYARTGRAWKRGYLLYGPPGTGKSTMVAAMANLLNYDVYDLELTAVKDNAELRRLLIETSGKSITVIEDIDCSLDLTGQRIMNGKSSSKKELSSASPQGDDHIGKSHFNASQVTLSGLLNFIDGIWSACGGERLVVFTTNHIERLDPALIRKGRMDMHIELSFCGFEAFKVLTRNYLKVLEHRLFERISELLPKAMMTPADVAEHLMPRSFRGDCDAQMKSLVESLEKKVREKEDKEVDGKGTLDLVEL